MMNNKSVWTAVLSAGMLFLLLVAGPAFADYSGHVASFKSENNAIAFVSKMQAKGLVSYYEKEDIPGKGIFYRTYIGSYKNLPFAKKALAKLKASGEIGYFHIQKKAEKKVEIAEKKTEALENKNEPIQKPENKAEPAAQRNEQVMQSENKTEAAIQKSEPLQKSENKIETVAQKNELVQKSENKTEVVTQKNETLQKQENKIEAAEQKKETAQKPDKKTQIIAQKSEPAQIPESTTEPSINTKHYYDGIKGIVLNNGKIVRGRIISVDDDVLKIRTRGGRILTYSFTKDVKEYIMTYEP